jgi:hyaluronate lyase
MEKGSDRSVLWKDKPIGGKAGNLFQHFERLEAMALAYSTAGSRLQGDARLADDIIKGLDWLQASHYNPATRPFGNWWEWEIGIPLSLNNSTALLYGKLTPEQVASYMASIDRFQPDIQMSGANRLWESEVIILRGVIGKNAEKITMGCEGLGNVLKYNQSWGDGFYEDGSFIQHGRIPYNGGYGKSLFRDITDVLYLLSGSTWDVKDPNKKNVFRWAYDSYEPFIYKGQIMAMTQGREMAQPSREPHKIGHQAIHPFVRLSQFAPPEDAARYKSMVKYWIEADSFRSFYEDVPSDIAAIAHGIVNDSKVVSRGELIKHQRSSMMARVVHLRPGFAFALSMNSNKVGSYEAINSTNARGWYTSDGMTYLYNNDLAQYSDDFWPTVNSCRLPGTTVDTVIRKTSEGNNALNPNDWVGGTDLDALYGIAGMQLKGFGVSLTAKKSWFMFADKIVALGSDINSTDDRTIETIVENRKIKDNGKNTVTVNGSTKPDKPGWSETMAGTNWVHLEGNVPGSDIGYYFPGSAGINILREERTDKWANICSASGDRDDTVHKRSYLTLWLDHGKSPKSATYSYVLLPNRTANQVETFAQSPTIDILENSSGVQAVRDRDTGITGANFWKDVPAKAGILSSNKKASVMLRETGSELTVSVSDPTQANKESIDIEIERSATATVSSVPGVTVTQLSPVIKLSVAVKDSKGKSFQIGFVTGDKDGKPLSKERP